MNASNLRFDDFGFLWFYDQESEVIKRTQKGFINNIYFSIYTEGSLEELLLYHSFNLKELFYFKFLPLKKIRGIT